MRSAKKALSLSTERAKLYGVSTTLIKNSHHNGALAAYMLPIVNKGFVPIIKSSVPSSATVAPFGGTKALLTPDPMALAFPTNNEPVIIDISASITTNNMIADKITKNELFDFNCLLTSDGIPTNDPKEVFEKHGTVMPVGGLEYGHKGFGLALGIEALSQGLSGSGRSKKPKSMNLSTFVQVIDPDAFAALKAFKHLGLKKIAVLTPYPKNVNVTVYNYLNDNNINVESFSSFNLEYDSEIA